MKKLWDISDETIKIAIYKGFKDISGSECIFYEYKGIGYKLYIGKKKRDTCYRRQERAAKFGLAPQVGRKFQFTSDRDVYDDEGNAHHKLSGYVTQLARVHDKEGFIEVDEEYGPHADAIQNLCTQLGVQADINYWDDHGLNFGFIGKKMVCIDFGSESCRNIRRKRK